MATAQQFEITEKDLAGLKSYDDLETPGDYEATLTEVEDYDKRDDGGSYGWKWTFEVEGLPFSEWTSFSPNARWKLLEILSAFGVEITEGVNNVLPDHFVESSIGVTVDWDPIDSKWDGVSPRYRRIASFYPVTDLTEVVLL